MMRLLIFIAVCYAMVWLISVNGAMTPTLMFELAAISALALWALWRPWWP